jgi:hypothetical protein
MLDQCPCPSDYLQIWGCSRDKSNEIVHDFFKSAHFKDGIPVVDGAHHQMSL